jgi:Glycosyl transferase family 2
VTSSSVPWSDRAGVIVLAAHQPDPELFRIQLESIRDQTLTNWRCLIGADSGQAEVWRLVHEFVGQDQRFEVVGWDDNVGFYLNFERLLNAVPDHVDWVALSDQDDRWYPDKLERLVPGLERVSLVSGQARLVAWPEGTVMLDRTTRRTVPPPYLLLMNQVTGSLSIFRRDLLDLALPFPRLDTVTQMHDHWLAVCAAVSHGYEVQDVVVQDYVQHSSNVVGEGARGLAAARRALAGLVDDADRTAGGHGPIDLARASAELSFGWRRVVRETIRERQGPSTEAVLRLPRSVGAAGSRRDSLSTAAAAVASPRVSRMTALTFVAGLPAELFRLRGPRTTWSHPLVPDQLPTVDSASARDDPIAVALVLYGTAPADSVALTTLMEAATGRHNRFRVFVYDNSGTSSAPTPDAGIEVYRWTPSNPGLAIHYQDALERAEQIGCTWLMLLDQDTILTNEYVDEVLQWADRLPDATNGPVVDVIAPRLISHGRRLSPHLRVRVRTRALWAPGVHGAVEGWQFLNSGAVVRVARVKSVGGFPVSYPLDYLDHAMSARLRRAGGSLLVMVAMLEHDFALLDRPTVSRRRQRSIAVAEERYFQEFGDPIDRTMLATRRAMSLVRGLRAERRPSSRAEELHALGRSLTAIVRRRPPEGPPVR